LIWYYLLSSTYKIYEYFKEKEILRPIIALIAYVCIVLIILVTQVIQFFSLWFSNLIIDFITASFSTWWGQTILVVGTIFVVSLLNIFSKKSRVYLRAIRMKKYQDKIKKVAEEGEEDLKQKKKNEQLELGLK